MCNGCCSGTEERRTPNQDLKTSGTKHIAFTVADLQAHLPDLVNYGVDIAAIQRNRGEPMAPEAIHWLLGVRPYLRCLSATPSGR